MEISHIPERLGRSMLFKGTIIVSGLLFTILTSCGNHTEAESKGGIELSERKQVVESTNHHSDEDSELYDTDTVSEADKNAVTLLVHSDKYDEYFLEDEQAQTIVDLFYNHEMQIIDSPLLSIATLTFQIGEDFLNTSMSDLGTLSGIINDEQVIIELSDWECEFVYQIVLQYSQGVP